MLHVSLETSNLPLTHRRIQTKKDYLTLARSRLKCFKSRRQRSVLRIRIRCISYRARARDRHIFHCFWRRRISSENGLETEPEIAWKKSRQDDRTYIGSRRRRCHRRRRLLRHWGIRSRNVEGASQFRVVNGGAFPLKINGGKTFLFAGTRARRLRAYEIFGFFSVGWSKDRLDHELVSHRLGHVKIIRLEHD